MITPVTNEKLNVIGGKVKVTIDVLKSNSDSSLPLLFEKFPEFYGLNIDDGVTVYIWQLSSKSYYCYLVSNATKMVKMFFREIKTIVLIYYYPLNLFSRANECEARESVSV